MCCRQGNCQVTSAHGSVYQPLQRAEVIRHNGIGKHQVPCCIDELLLLDARRGKLQQCLTVCGLEIEDSLSGIDNSFRISGSLCQPLLYCVELRSHLTCIVSLGATSGSFTT